MYQLALPPTETDHYLGSLSSPLVLLEYGDYECPHSMKSWAWMKKYLEEFKEDLCFVYRHFPLDDIHPHSVLAASAAETAGTNGKFWQMHDLLYSRHEMISKESIFQMAKTLEMNFQVFLQNLERKDITERIENNFFSGEDSGVISTPAFFLNSMRMEGPISYEILRNNIIKMLAGQSLSA